LRRAMTVSVPRRARDFLKRQGGRGKTQSVIAVSKQLMDSI
jgi:hypothetical protein